MTQATSSLASANLRSRFRSELSAEVLRTLIARAVAAIGSFALVAVIGWFYGAKGVGVFALAQSVLMAAAIVAGYGMENALMRFVGRDPQSRHVRVYLSRACLKALLLSALTATVVFAMRGLWARWFDAPELVPVLVGFAIATPPFTLAFILAGFMRAIRKPAMSCLLQNGAIALLAALVLPLFGLLSPGNIVNVGAVYAAVAWLVFGWGLWRCLHWLHRDYKPSPDEDVSEPEVSAFDRSSSAFFANSLSSLITDSLAVWLSGYFLATADVGLLKVALQIAMLVGVVRIVMNSVFPARFASLYHRGGRQALASLARRSVRLGFVLAAVPALVCFAVPGILLRLAGHDFAGAGNLLRIFAGAQLVYAACGSVEFLLAMTGQERLVRDINLVCGMLAIGAIVVLAPLWGAIAIAFALALCIVAKNLCTVYFAWRRLGIRTLPSPALPGRS